MFDGREAVRGPAHEAGATTLIRSEYPVPSVH
jgi:hypothetical protein